ncbi:hypothetical protein A3Q34_09460 [Colwellia sp. PAMC 20917]|uniref:hypothetical protein n=1 Tax=Colwellia sp. PAMC 20917 TaxID=1816218 RepID=UPI0008791BC8|nr:hypothetical protein [Colwellia sp. PAMC 20917]AOW77063.1 hypothetical protein A3Q34_09460 [Colwellia sp. PAMC 20917]
MAKTVVISCWFGKRFDKPNEETVLANFKAAIKYLVKSVLPARLYPLFNVQSVVPIAPNNCDRAIFFTNNKLLKKEVLLKGWKYEYLQAGEIGEIGEIDSIDSSLIAKKIKFLQLEQRILNELYSFDYVLYVDSRAIVDDIVHINSLCDKGLVIRYSPEYKNKNTVWDEINEAKVVERYAAAMPETISFVENKIKDGEYTDQNKVMATGVILYKLGDMKYRNRIISLCNEVYDTCVKLNQPECQIIWCILSQPYDDLMTKVKAQNIQTRST